jgi:hypothetical protein
VLYSVLIAVGEELVPVICIVLFVALRQFDDIKNATPEIKFQLLKLKIELAASLVLDIVIKLVAFHHFLLVLDDDVFKDSLDVLFLLVCLFRRVFRLYWFFVAF